jgi:hypothetical protein
MPISWPEEGASGSAPRERIQISQLPRIFAGMLHDRRFPVDVDSREASMIHYFLEITGSGSVDGAHFFFLLKVLLSDSEG